MGARGIRVWAGLLLAGVVAISVVAVSPAAVRRNHLQAVIASRVHAFHQYFIGASGYAAHRARVYALIDEQRCGPNPEVEYQVHHAGGQSWTVSGSFDKHSGPWTSSYRGVEWLCVYLQDATQPAYGTTGVLLRASKKYRELCPANSSPITSSEGVPVCSVPRS